MRTANIISSCELSFERYKWFPLRTKRTCCATLLPLKTLIFPGFGGHPEASHKLKVSDGLAGEENKAAFLYGGQQAPSRGPGGQQRTHADVGSRQSLPASDVAVPVGRGKVERLMRHHCVRGLIAQRRRVQTTDSGHLFPVAAIMDLHTRKIVGRFVRDHRVPSWQPRR